MIIVCAIDVLAGAKLRTGLARGATRMAFIVRACIDFFADAINACGAISISHTFLRA